MNYKIYKRDLFIKKLLLLLWDKQAVEMRFMKSIY